MAQLQLIIVAAGGATKISKQETLNLSAYKAWYDLIIPKDNMLHQINDFVDFSYILANYLQE